ncbi:UvrD-helicase domain-containing protein [Myxosarcina sp. GI1]|uniref:UvrD-helicase domain-containing protein n=1 Tax=Myxosarcina sp. GI1 TaxID=1541065 RepID=UPI00068C831B|nr:UvrD-helicase domain-containing protein [Myxosarcina sp. GI1]
MLLPVILHPDVTEFLRTKKFQEDWKNSTWKCIDKLRQQSFDVGLRAKKLKGVAKGVWEARITSAIRLIYTYEKSIAPDTKQPLVYIAVQDICLDHDDVFQRAKARIRTPDARWLDAEVIREVGNLKTNCDALLEEELDAILEAIDEELQILEDITDELLGNIQWQVLESELDWHKAIVEQDENLPLRLSVEESALVNHYGNLLLSGSAGTGKTTVGLYQLLKSLERFDSGKRLYVAYNPVLVKETSKQFQKIVGKKIEEIESWFQFQTIRDLCSQILLKAGETYLEYNEVDYQVFERLYCHQSISRIYPAALVWDEIRSIIKGSCLRTDAEAFSLTEYEALGKNQSSVIAPQERPNIYKIAQWYQNYLKEEKRFNEIDLARQALKYIQHEPQYFYQMIVCDEVQDLTELQLYLLMQLIAPDGHLVFAGDLYQMISPSGFRWEDLKSLFYYSEHLSIINRQVVEKKLHFNFRSVDSLVRLANQILILRSRLLLEKINDSDYLDCQSSKSVLIEKSARLINAPPENIKPIVKQLYSGDAVLVRTQEQKEKLCTELDSSLVFTIEEAKGLEFDTVFLVEFFLPHQDLWSKAIKGIPVLKDKEIPQLRLELNLLYVAITRARRILNVWEERLSVVWNQGELVDLVQQIDAESVRMERLESTVRDWQEKGLYYLDNKRYRQAIECFENSGDAELKWQASAKLALQEEEYTKAAEFFVKLEDWQQAASLLEKEAQWSQAAIYWSKADNTHKQQVCQARALELELEWEDAALIWEKLNYSKEARKCWLKSDNELKKVETRIATAKEFETKEQWQEAAEQYKLAKLPQEAAKLFERDRKWAKAAEQYQLARMPEKAIKCIAKSTEDIAKYFVNKQEWFKAAQQYQLARMPEKAAEYRAWYFVNKQEWFKAARQYALAGVPIEAARQYEKIKLWDKAARQYELAQMSEEAILCKAKSFESDKRWQQAAEQYALARMPVRAAKLFERDKQWAKAAEQYAFAGMNEEVILCQAKSLESNRQWQQAAKQYELARMPVEADRCRANDFEARKQWQQAAVCWGELGNVKRQQVCENKEVARCQAKIFENNKQWKKASEQYSLAGMLKEVTLCRAKIFESNKRWQQAAGQYALAGMPVRAAKLFEMEKQWSQAAEQYELAGMTEQADNCRERLLLSSEQLQIDSKRTQNIGYKTIADANIAIPKVEKINILEDLSFFKSNNIWGDPEVELSRLEQILPTFNNIIGNREYRQKCQTLIDNQGKGDRDLYTMYFWLLHAMAWYIKTNKHKYNYTPSHFLKIKAQKIKEMSIKCDNHQNFVFGLNNYVRIANKYTNNGAVISCNLQTDGFVIPDWLDR